MRKMIVVQSIINVLNRYSEEHGFELKSKEYGQAFKGTIWDDYLKDDSHIPEIHWVHKNTSELEIRSFWGSPEMDVRLCDENGNFEALLVLTWSSWNDKEQKSTDDFNLYQVRVDSYQYDKDLKQALEFTELVHKEYEELEKNANY